METRARLGKKYSRDLLSGHVFGFLGELLEGRQASSGGAGYIVGWVVCSKGANGPRQNSQAGGRGGRKEKEIQRRNQESSRYSESKHI